MLWEGDSRYETEEKAMKEAGKFIRQWKTEDGYVPEQPILGPPLPTSCRPTQGRSYLKVYHVP